MNALHMFHMAHYPLHPSSVLLVLPLPPSPHLSPGPVGRSDSGSRQSAALNKCIRGRWGREGTLAGRGRAGAGGRTYWVLEDIHAEPDRGGKQIRWGLRCTLSHCLSSKGFVAFFFAYKFGRSSYVQNEKEYLLNFLKVSKSICLLTLQVFICKDWLYKQLLLFPHCVACLVTVLEWRQKLKGNFTKMSSTPENILFWYFLINWKSPHSLTQKKEW